MTEVGPRACDEWIVLFQRFGSGDDTTLAEMRCGTLELASCERARWRAALTGTLRQRFIRLSKQVDERLSVAITVGNMSALLGWTRAQVTVLYCFTRVPAFPTFVRIRA